MKVVFLYWGYENPGIEALSAALKKAGHETSLVFDPALFNTFHIMNSSLKRIFDIKDKLLRKIIDGNPDLVAISTLSEDYDWACEMASLIKKEKDISIIFGGKHPTAVPEKVIENDFVDYVCVGEGDLALVELADALEQDKPVDTILNIWSKKNRQVIRNPVRRLIVDLDSLPFPDKDIFYNEYLNFRQIYTISTSRGCPHACSYCHNSFARKLYQDKGPYLRRRSVDNVITELVEAKQKYKIKKIYFLDEIFIYDLNWLKDFSLKYKELVGLPFGCEVYSSYVNEEVVSVLEAMGCLAVDMGMQTISEDLREEVLQRRESNEDIKKAIALFRKTRIFLYIGVILGLPKQDEQEALKMAVFFNQHKPDLILTSWLRYYPKTAMIDIAMDSGMLEEKDIKKIEEGGGFSPFVRRGHTFKKSLGKVAHLILISPFISKRLMNWLIEKKVYLFFPSKTFWHLNLNSLFGTWYKKLIERREKLLYFTVWGQLKFMGIYMWRRLAKR